MEYDIIKRDWREQLIEAVNKAIKAGWKPIGGVCSNCNASGGYLQAMIKE